MTDSIIRYRWPIIIVSVLITLFFGAQLPRATFNMDFATYIPEDIPARINTEEIDDIFGGSEVLMIMLETEDVLNEATLKRVRSISRQANRTKGIDQVMSLFDTKEIRGEDGMMIVDPAIKRIPRTPEQREIVRAALKDNDLAYEIVVSTDFKLTAVMLILSNGVNDREIMAAVQGIVDDNPGNEKVLIGGMPETRTTMQRDFTRDAIMLLPISLIVILIILYITFRQLRGVLLPFTVVVMSVLFGVGLQIMLGWDLTIISILLPVMLIAIANNYGIHLVAKYQELNTKGGFESRNDLIRAILDSLNIPILLTGLTTIAGILGLLSHTMIPAKHLGVMAAAGIAYALVLSLFFLPAVMSLLPRPNPEIAARRREKNLIEKTLPIIGAFVVRHTRMVIVIIIMISALVTVGLKDFQVDSNVINFFPPSHATWQTADIINNNFGGSENISILVTGDIKDPEILKRMDYYGSELKKLPDVGNVSSLATVVKAMSRALNDPDELGYDAIPSTRLAVAQYLELYNMSGDPEDFEKLVDFNYENARITVTINNPDASAIQNVVDKFNELAAGDKSIRKIGGTSMVTTELSNLVVRGQVISLSVAIIVIGILLALMFRSFAAGLIGIIPLAMSINLLFGLMGFLGIRLDIATALLSSIMIGVGVDYTIHFLWRYQLELKNGQEYRQAVIDTLTTTGRGITFNAVSVMLGLAVVLLSTFPPLQFFGFLVLVSIAGCLVGALVVVPAICLLWKPQFLEVK